MQFHAAKHRKIQGEWDCLPDHDNVRNALLLASLASGRSSVELPHSLRPSLEAFETFLSITGAHSLWRPEGVVIEGGSLAAPPLPSPLPPLPSDRWEAILSLALLARYPGVSIKLPAPGLTDALVSELAPLLNFTAMRAEADTWLLEFSPELPKLPKPDIGGEIEPEAKALKALLSIMRGQPFACQEKTSGKDGLVRSLLHFGVPGEIAQLGGEEMDEMARRMARLQGKKTERQVQTRLEAVRLLSGRDTPVFGDPTLGATVGLAACLLPGSEIQIRSALFTPGRAGVYGALRRMGADLEPVSKREKAGENYGILRARHTRRLMGRKLGPEIIATCPAELPLLAVAAAFAEGETILDCGEQKAQRYRPILENMALNLRKAGVDVGVYEEGLVIRGREECDGSDFHAGDDPISTLALGVLASRAQGEASVTTSVSIENMAPGLCQLFGWVYAN